MNIANERDSADGLARVAPLIEADLTSYARSVFLDVNTAYYACMIGAVSIEARRHGYVFARCGSVGDGFKPGPLIHEELARVFIRAKYQHLAPKIPLADLESVVERDIGDGAAQAFLNQILLSLERQGVSLVSDTTNHVPDPRCVPPQSPKPAAEAQGAEGKVVSVIKRMCPSSDLTLMEMVLGMLLAGVVLASVFLVPVWRSEVREWRNIVHSYERITQACPGVDEATSGTARALPDPRALTAAP